MILFAAATGLRPAEWIALGNPIRRDKEKIDLVRGKRCFGGVTHFGVHAIVKWSTVVRWGHFDLSPHPGLDPLEVTRACRSRGLCSP